MDKDAEIAALRAEVTQLRMALNDVLYLASSRKADGVALGPNVWRLGLGDIVAEAQAALKESNNV